MKRALGKHDSDTWVEGSGFVVRLLTDDRDGGSHQRFVLNIGNGQTLLVAHNIELAERVPLGIGDRVRFRGVYEWSELGGTLHWTHHDPLGDEDGGFIDYRRKIYR